MTKEMLNKQKRLLSTDMCLQYYNSFTVQLCIRQVWKTHLCFRTIVCTTAVSVHCNIMNYMERAIAAWGTKETRFKGDIAAQIANITPRHSRVSTSGNDTVAKRTSRRNAGSSHRGNDGVSCSADGRRGTRRTVRREQTRREREVRRTIDHSRATKRF